MHNVKELIISIDKVNRGELDSSFEIGIANEVLAANYIDCTYKLIELSKHSYDNYHFRVGDNYYEVFVYTKETIDTDNMYQIILCDNYTQIYQFNQKDYNNRKLVGSFQNPGKIYSFHDGSVIVFKNDKPGYYAYENLVP